MRSFALVLAVAALAAGCRKVPVRNVYCDGTSRWVCADPAYPRCDAQQKLCLPALADGGVDLGQADLAGCASSADCPDDRPICDARVCRACAGSGDDGVCLGRSAATPRCFAASGSCAACAVAGVESGDCAAATPICGSGGACRGCTTHAECSAQLCNLDGSCAAAAMIAYADNAGGTCTGTHAATLADPACDVAAALAVQSTVRVLGSSASYPHFSLGSGSVRIVGADTKPSATISGDSGNPAISISGMTTTALLDELEIIGSGTNQPGVSCINTTLGPSLAMRRCSIHGVNGVGISATNCTVALDRDQIGPGDAGGGVSLSGAPYTVTNCFIVANGSGGPGALLGSGATAMSPGFMHNTVVSNAAGGILCSGATTIANSIVESNALMDTSGACTLTGSTSLVPEFVSASDYHLAGRTAANLACCIDQLTTSPVDHDFDGRARPQPTNGKWDVGAHEVP
jgi:hypothetical protein